MSGLGLFLAFGVSCRARAEERRYASGRAERRFAPSALGPPLPVCFAGTQRSGAYVNTCSGGTRKRPCNVRKCTFGPRRSAAAGLARRATRLLRRADGLGDEVGDVLGVLARVQPARHLPVPAGAAVLDRVEHERLVRADLVETRADGGDRVRRLERVAVRAAQAEQLATVLLGLVEVGDVGLGDVVLARDGRDHRGG